MFLPIPLGSQLEAYHLEAYHGFIHSLGVLVGILMYKQRIILIHSTRVPVGGLMYKRGINFDLVPRGHLEA
ncbi:hypothetical protein CHS0354_010281 [Potamilus streckersoni]|uniref:Uncharacterized protein n=1 Tax=Potamilus streckersoni TaxID=2493646 RepID=A0AAE0TCY2_9BIVA|nr:hypothetical protein CHS0354_010281 [Potamilus streckersoni]